MERGERRDGRTWRPPGGLGWYSVPNFPLGSLQEEQWPGCFLPECLSCGQGCRGGGGSAQQRGILLATTQNQWRLVCPAAWGVARHAGEGTWTAGWERRVLGCASLEHCSGPRLATPLSSSSFKKKKKTTSGGVGEGASRKHPGPSSPAGGALRLRDGDFPRVVGRICPRASFTQRSRNCTS